MSIVDKRSQLIEYFESTVPEELVYNLSHGTGSLKKDLKAVNYIRRYNLPEGVLNVLIHFTLINWNYKLSIGFLEKMAGHWLQRRVKTVREAIEISIIQKEKYEEWMVNDEKEESHDQTTKVNKVEINEFNAIKIAANSMGISAKDLGKFVREILEAKKELDQNGEENQ